MGTSTSLVPFPAENVRFVSVSRKGGKLDPSRNEEVEVDEGVDCDESSESTGVRPRVTACLVVSTPAVVPCGKAAPAGGLGTTAATPSRGATMREILGTPVYSSAGTPAGFAMSTPLQHRSVSTRLGALPAPARRLNGRQLFLRRTRRIIALRPTWEGRLLAS